MSCCRSTEREHEMRKPKVGDYVLATKYSDGDPQDHWAVGFYDRFWRDRYFVVDNHSVQFRMNGFRRIAKIRDSEGEELLRDSRAIEHSGRSVWGHLRRIRRERKAAAQKGKSNG